jgi:hypothetical protein
MWLCDMFIILSGEGIRRPLYLISSFRNEQEHCSSCNNSAINQANKGTRFILRFVKL